MEISLVEIILNKIPISKSFEVSLVSRALLLLLSPLLLLFPLLVSSIFAIFELGLIVEVIWLGSYDGINVGLFVG